MKNNIRFLAQVTIQAKTPLKIGSNTTDFMQDSPVQKDWNNLPMILGTSITGILRDKFKNVSKNKTNDIFGEENGSRFIVSNALLVDEKDNVNEELLLEKDRTCFLKLFDNLPIREHTSIDNKGVTKQGAKFDEEVVFKGAKFRFELELISDGLEHKEWHNLLYILQSEEFRLGSGSTKGFGSFENIEIKMRVLNLEDKNDMQEYINKSSSLNDTNLQWQDFIIDDDNILQNNYTKYTLKLTPDDFFLFGSGFGDNEADMTPVYEQVIDYKIGGLSKNMILIPASSIKGAISHRVAFCYNKYLLKNDKTADYKKTGEENEAVKAIFGHKKEEDKKTKKELGQKGKILISDCFKPKAQEKVFDHVAIDRFTGGGIDGALFQEKTIADDREYIIEILLENGIDEEYIQAFEKTLKDICSGMLPLGGATTKGHGVFCGKVFKDGVELKDE